MRSSIQRIMLVSLAVPWLAAQAQQPPAPTRQELENTLRILERQVAAQQDRVDTVTERLKTTDEQIERRIDRVLGHLVTVTDSPDSRSKVMNAKMMMFDGLKTSIEFYARERGQRFAALYRPSSRATKEGLADDVTRLNRRIEKRVDQALAVVASLPAERDIAKYQRQYDGDNSYERTNPAYAHQQRMMSHGASLREKACADLTASIDRLGRSRQELQRALSYAKTEDGRKFVQDLIQQNADLVAKRRDQIQTAITQSKPSSQPLGGNAADALVKMMEEERANNRKDNGEWIRLKNERDVERDRLHIYKDRLANYQQRLERAPVQPGGQLP